MISRLHRSVAVNLRSVLLAHDPLRSLTGQVAVDLLPFNQAAQIFNCTRAISHLRPGSTDSTMGEAGSCASSLWKVRVPLPTMWEIIAGWFLSFNNPPPRSSDHLRWKAWKMHRPSLLKDPSEAFASRAQILKHTVRNNLLQWILQVDRSLPLPAYQFAECRESTHLRFESISIQAH
jgi:hypothetical protein